MLKNLLRTESTPSTAADGASSFDNSHRRESCHQISRYIFQARLQPRQEHEKNALFAAKVQRCKVLSGLSPMRKFRLAWVPAASQRPKLHH
jgi:hypothetical protein